MKKYSKIFSRLLFFIVFSVTIYAAVSSLVYVENGKLTYRFFAMQNQTNKVNIIPDYSYAGYMGGGVALPEISPGLIKQVVSPVKGDDGLNIQSAINYVESLPLDGNGLRGAVLLKKGNYDVNGTITIKASGVILIGEGQGEEGTVLTATLSAMHDFIIVKGSGNGIVEDTHSKVRITSSYVPVGSNRFTVEDASGFSVGDTVSVKKTPNDLWINDLDMAQYGWTTNAYRIKHERIITGISDDTIKINIPLVDVIEDKYGGGTLSKATLHGRISNCGIQNIRLKSIYNTSNDEEHAWNAIVLKRVTNSWIKNVTAMHFAKSCVTITNESDFNTIEDCANLEPVSDITGMRRYSFYIANGLGNLIQRCYSNYGRHDYTVGARVTGPNVFLDCYAEETYNDIGPHHRWATGTLFDNVYGGQIRVQNRKDMGSGHGWAGAQTMFWNLKSYKDDIKVESPTGAQNWAIGCEGSVKNGNGFWEHWNERVTPRSLYLQQLQDRLGTTAIENITLPEQRGEQTIWEYLKNWKGNGNYEISLPGKATDPYPKSGASGIPDTLILKWKAGIDATSHDVYFGTSDPPAFIRNQSGTYFEPGKISDNIIYYWRIDEKNDVGITTGNVWTFSRIKNLVHDTIYVAEDTFVQGGEKADSNFGADNILVVKSNNLGKYVRETFLKFQLSSNSNSSQINKAVLLLKVNKEVTGVSHKVNYIEDDNWSESSVTFNSKPAYSVTLDTKSVPALHEWIEFDVTEQTRNEIENDKVIGFAISESSYNHYCSYKSKESGLENAPRLIITYGEPTGIRKESKRKISTFCLEQNFPNPFNPTTTIKYIIPSLETLHTTSPLVRLKVYNILGKKIATLVNKKQKPGTYQVTFDASGLASGIYFYKLQIGNFTDVKKMILLR